MNLAQRLLRERFEQAEARREMARMIFALDHADAHYLSKALGHDAYSLSKTQWAQMSEFVLERRYGDMGGAVSLHPNGGISPYRRQHPVDWIRWLTDEGSFREF